MKNSELQDLFVEYYPASCTGCVFAFVGENESAAGGPGCVGLFIPNGAFPGD